GGARRRDYSARVLAVRRRPVSAPLPAVALTEPVSRLESRIRALLSAPSRLRRAAALASSPLVIVALVVACTLTPPRLFAQDAGAGATTRDALTGMVEGGERIVILVDTSASMLDSTLINVLRRRSMSAEERSAAPKWQQVVGTVEQLAAQIARGTQVQIIGFAEQARTLIEGSGGQWVTVTDGRELEAAVQALRATAPSGPSSLAAAIDAVRALQPPPAHVYLLVDGLPTMGETRPDRDGVTGSERADHFYRAIRNVPLETPFNVLLFPLEGDPWAAPLYWELALRTGGALVTAPLATRTSALTPLDVPEDEYVVFIVDTSGSMQSYAWDRMQQQIRETLEVYPTVKGIQIMNDEGTYMFTSRRGEWMPDTPATRQAIIDGMRNWKDYSDSSPREGILAAIDTFYDPNDPKKISLYVYSDDFSRGSISAVVREIDRRNKADEQGNRRVRIHAVAFPVFWQV